MKFPYDEKALLYRELAKLHNAGFPLTEAIDTVLDTHPPEASTTLLLAVKSGLADSKTIGDAFASASEVPVTELENTIIAASERGGVIGDGFDHLSGYFEMRATTAKELRRKMVYPLVLLHVAILVPVLPLMIGASNPERVLLTSGLTLLGVYALLIAIMVGGRRLAVKAESNPGVDRLLARVPLLGKVRQNLALARFSSVFRMHLLAGERIDEGLRSAAASSQSGRIVQSVRTRAIPSVEDGHPAGPALARDAAVFTPAFARGFTTAEQSGTLDTDLARWSHRFQEAARASMDKLGSYAPKFFYAFIVLIVLWQVYRLVAKIYGFYNQAFQYLD